MNGKTRLFLHLSRQSGSHGAGILADACSCAAALVLRGVHMQTVFLYKDNLGGRWAWTRCVEPRLAERILLSLKVSNAFLKDVCTLVTYHDDKVDAQTAKLLMYKVGPERFESLVSLRRADLLAHAPRVMKELSALDDAMDRYRLAMERHECVSLKDLAVNGDDMMALGYRGPEIREALENLL